MCNTSTSKVIFLAVVIKIMSAPLNFFRCCFTIYVNLSQFVLISQVSAALLFFEMKTSLSLHILPSKSTNLQLNVFSVLSYLFPSRPTDIHDFSEFTYSSDRATQTLGSNIGWYKLYLQFGIR